MTLKCCSNFPKVYSWFLLMYMCIVYQSHVFQSYPLSPLISFFTSSMQSGYWQTILMIIIGYLVVILTVLSISAIATSATVEGGGVYCILNN